MHLIGLIQLYILSIIRVPVEVEVPSKHDVNYDNSSTGVVKSRSDFNYVKLLKD